MVPFAITRKGTEEMLSWFEKTAPIRTKFNFLLAIHAFWGVVGIGGAALAASGAGALGIAVAVAAFVLSALTVVISGKLISGPYVATVERMEALAAGDFASRFEHGDHGDCVGRMVRAMATFRDNGMKVQGMASEQDAVVSVFTDALEAVAAGNLSYQITKSFDGDNERLRQVFNDMVVGLERVISQVAGSAQSVNTGSNEIRAASEDLARRTEQQASSLGETSMAMAQVTEMVSETAQGAAEVRGAIDGAHKDATEGGAVVGKAVNAMDAIEKSSQEIGQIINVIDGIAFQTNLLALNAGVEAARAGDAGRGFAVVANEVRALAQRSADAAKDIKSLITTSSEQVNEGVALVGETGKMLERIMLRIGEVNTLIQDIAKGTEQQATNLKQVNEAVNGMDRMTQQNAAMVEESTAAARSLAAEADELSAVVSRFQLNNGRAVSRTTTRATAPARPKAPAARRPAPPVAQGNLAVKAVPAPASATETDEDWTEF